MEHEYSLLWEVTVWEFILVTVCLAGGAAYLTGRAVAKSWLGNAQLVGYVVLLAAATRFIHYALFQGSLLTLHYFIVDLLVLLVIAFVGKQITRARQMATQYGFRFTRSGPLHWVERD